MNILRNEIFFRLNREQVNLEQDFLESIESSGLGTGNDHAPEGEEVGVLADGDNGAPSYYVASGYPVSTAPDGQSGSAALKRIASLLTKGDYAALSDFDGPFLVLAYIPKLDRIVVVRDKFGLRSAYYIFELGQFLLTDNISRIKEAGGFRAGGIIEWLHYGAPLAPFTHFNDVKTIPAGTLVELSLTERTIKQFRYFSPQAYVSKEVYAKYESSKGEFLRSEFESIFDQAVSRMLVGHDRVSILLSGGVDSSLLAAFARHHATVSAVTVDLYGPGSESEKTFAEAVAKNLEVSLHSIRFGPSEFNRSICKTIRDLASPIIIENAVALHHAALHSALPTGQLVMDGEGADALMAGSTSLFKYSMYVRHFAGMLSIGTPNFRRFIERVRAFMTRLGLTSRSTLDGMGLDVDLGARRMEISYLTDSIADSFAHIDSREEREIATLMIREFYDYLVPLMLRIDKMSAIARTHTLLPYLSGPVFEFLENLPMRHKIARAPSSLKTLNKALLKKVLENFIPKDLIYRPKVGFGIPAWDWIRFPEPWRNDSCIASIFGISTHAFQHWLESNNGRDKVFLFSLEIWARLFIWKCDFDEVEATWWRGNKVA